MRVYRITLEPFSHRLCASGQRARWNSKGTFVIYTASNRSLACLENVVHRGGEGLNAVFRTMIIEIPNNLDIEVIEQDSLPVGWQDFTMQNWSRRIGDEWVRAETSPILKVPSAIIPMEHNYLINPNHPDFKFIKLISTEKFVFDSRLG